MVFLLGGGLAIAQEDAFGIGELDSLMRLGDRPVLVLMATDGCKYCLMQKHQLARNDAFSDPKNRHFHYVVFDAESRDPVTLGRETFRYKPSGPSSGIHELAIALNGSEQLAFPTWVLLGADSSVLFRHGGVLNPPEMKELLRAIGQMAK